MQGLSLLVVSGGHSLVVHAGFSLWCLLLLRSTGSREHGLQQSQQAGSIVVQGLSCLVMWDPPGPRIEPVSPALSADSQPLDHQGSPLLSFE